MESCRFLDEFCLLDTTQYSNIAEQFAILSMLNLLRDCVINAHAVIHPFPDHRVYDTGYTVLSDSARRSAILAAIPTMSRSKEGAEPYLVVQSTDGEIVSGR